MIYEITAAGGNGTIIETNGIYEQLGMRGKELLALSGTAEQVGFIKKRKFEMAGGEFCGNGSRAAAIILTNFKSGKVAYFVSGFPSEVVSEVEKLSGNLFKVSTKFDGLKYSIGKKSDCILVKFDGITHIVIKGIAPDNARNLLLKNIKKYHLGDELAVGLLYVKDNMITSFVFVKEVGSIYEETACGSGAIAVFLAYGVEDVIQPTGKTISVSKIEDSLILSSEMEVLDKKSDIYERLFDQILLYDDVNKQLVRENNEKMTRLNVDFAGIRAEFQPIARERVVKMLDEVERCLPDELKLQVVNSYRPLEVQKMLFEQEMAKYSDKIQDELERKRFVHKFSIAAPECAGHPTGGAVDVQLIKDGTPMDFGTDIWTFSTDTMTFSPFISEEAQRNRLFLRDVMVSVGFAPFNGEWWHFSYGDQEWAAYYKRRNAIYGQI